MRGSAGSIERSCSCKDLTLDQVQTAKLRTNIPLTYPRGFIDIGAVCSLSATELLARNAL